MIDIRRVYLAGPYNAPDVISALDNIRDGIRDGARIFMAGYAVYVPWLDHQQQFQFPSGYKPTYEQYYETSLRWLEVCDVVVVRGNWLTSRGTKLEIARAKELGIPIFYGVDAFLDYVSESGPKEAA